MADPRAVLRIPDFRRFLTAHLATTLGVLIQEVVVAWQMYLDTRDPLTLGLVGLFEAVPTIVMSLYAGHITDRMDRRRLMLLATTALLICAATLAWLAGLPPERRQVRVVGVFTVLIITGFARAFLQPARTALAASMVPRELMATAVTWRSAVWQLAAVLGPALGGILIALIGPGASYLVGVGLIAFALLTLLRITHRAVPAVPQEESLRASLAAGFRFLRSQQVLLGAMTLDLFSVLFGGAVALIPVFTEEILHAGPRGLGLLRAAPAIGALTSSAVIAWRPPMRRAGRSMLQAIAIFGCCIIGFGLSRSLWLSFALLVVSGAADMVSVVIRSTLLQLLVPDHLMGRVTSVNSIFIGSSNEIGSFESGVAARLLGTVPSVIVGGCITLGVVGVTSRMAPDLLKVGRLDEVGRQDSLSP